MSNSYLFVLGNFPELSLAELENILPKYSQDYSIRQISSSISLVKSSLVIDCVSMVEKLGGVQKISQVQDVVDEVTPDGLIGLLSFQNESITFGISNYTGEQVDILFLSKEIKKSLQRRGLKVRFVLPSEGRAYINSVVLNSQKVQEIVLVKESLGKWIVAKTVSIQNSLDWSSREFNRPHSDARSGMLPLKVSRMMLNLLVFSPEKLKVLDPFCGMGSIVNEGLMLGYDMIGSDLSKSAVQNAEKNTKWLVQKYNLSEAEYEFILADAVHVSTILKPQSVDAIVTEPFMGKPFHSKEEVLYQGRVKTTVREVQNIVKGLEKLYIGALKDWKKILKPKGVVVLVLPSIFFEKREYFVKKVLDSCEKVGYSIFQGPYRYNRPNAVVARNIYKLISL